MEEGRNRAVAAVQSLGGLVVLDWNWRLFGRVALKLMRPEERRGFPGLACRIGVVFDDDDKYSGYSDDDDEPVVLREDSRLGSELPQIPRTFAGGRRSLRTDAQSGE